MKSFIMQIIFLISSYPFQVFLKQHVYNSATAFLKITLAHTFLQPL